MASGIRSKIIIGTRRSSLAKWQSQYIAHALTLHHPDLHIDIHEIITQGDRTQSEDKPLPLIGGKGLFTAELEEALHGGEIDLAVHSLKDLPTDLDKRYVLGAIPERGPANDVLVSNENRRFEDLPSGAVIGSSSFRRSAQLKRLRPDIEIKSIRGNVDTRISKVRAKELGYDGVVLAEAGVIRLGLESEISEIFSLENMLPAAAQGALAVQCRAGDDWLLSILRPIHHFATAREVSSERAFLEGLNAGCNMPVSCIAKVSEDRLSLWGRCLSLDGSRVIELKREGSISDAEQIGRNLAADALARGAKELIS